MLVSTLDLLRSVTVPVVGLTASVTDLLRLVAIPVFAWAAYRDIETRRVPTRMWYPLAALALVSLVLDGYVAYTAGNRLFFLQVAISIGFIIPLVTAFWYLGSFGGADTKAFYVIALLFPVFPTYYFPGIALPMHPTTVGVFSLTILSNTVVAGALYPAGVALSNLLRGRIGLPMVIGRPIATDTVTEEYGMLVETLDGFTTRGLDLDALRMYLRWRQCSLAELRSDPDRFRDPGSLPAVPGDVEDGNIVTDGGSEDERSESAYDVSGDAGPASSKARDESEARDENEAPDEGTEEGASDGRAGAERHASGEEGASDGRAGAERHASGEEGASDRRAGAERHASSESPDSTDGVASTSTVADETAPDDAETAQYDDPWGAEAFLDDIETGAYGTSPEGLREGLDVLAAEDEVWISPGIPFIVPMFAGLVLSLTYGDVLVSLLSAVGLG